MKERTGYKHRKVQLSPEKQSENIRNEWDGQRMNYQYEDITLRLFEKRDIQKKVEWINNPENNRYLHYDLPLSTDRTTEWFESKDNSRRLDCVIEYDSLPVGIIGLLQIDKVNKKAEYYITIGEKKYKRRGIAFKATKAILEYAYKELKLHKVYLTVDAKNEKAIHLYEKVGFKQEGYFVDDLYHKNSSEFIDRVRFSKFWGRRKLYYEIRFSNFALFNRTIIQDLGEYQNNHLYIKREDLIPFSFGGNKARKAELFFENIDEGCFDCVVTYGSGSSNHCRIVANECCRRGMECYIISPEEASEPTFNSRMMDLFGAQITTVPVVKVHDTIDGKLAKLKAEGKNPYFIEGGGHGDIGTEAYVQCYQEIREQEKEFGVHFDYIFFASGTGTTHAGLVCGQIKYNDDRHIIGISIARKNPRGREVVLDSIRKYMPEIAEEEIQKRTVFLDQYTGDGYGKENSEIEDTIKESMIKYGIPLDSTYTGKAFLGMKKYIEEMKIQNKNILFIHTGGTPLFFDDFRKIKDY